MGFDFRPAEAKRDERRMSLGTKAAHETHQELRKRAKFLDDTEFWICVCFQSQSDAFEFERLTGLKPGCEYSGDEMRAACEPIRPHSRIKQFKRPKPTKQDDASSLSWTGSQPTWREWLWLMATGALCEMVSADSECEASGGGLWFAAYFLDRTDKEDFLAEQNASCFGEKYVDGSAWLKALNRRAGR